MLNLRNVVISALLGTTLALGSTGCSVKFNRYLSSSTANLGTGTTGPSGTPAVPTALQLNGSTADLASTCSTVYTVTSVGSGATAINVPADAPITLSGKGAGTFYSDAACTQVITSVTIPSGSSSATFYFKDGSLETLTFTAATTGLTSATLPVTVVSSLPDAAHSTISAAPASVTANGTTTSTVTITLLDSSGNPVVGVTPQFASTGTGNTLVQAVSATDASGVATGTIASTKAETKTLSISSPTGLGTDTTTVTFVPGPADIAHSLVSVSAATIASGSTSNLTLTAKDVHDNSITSGGLTVAFSFSGGGSAGTIGAVTDNGDGTYTAVLTGTTSGTASTVHATIGGSAVTSSLPTVTVTPGTVSLSQSAITVSAATIFSGNTSTLTLTAKDAAGNQLTSGGLTVAFTYSGGGSAGSIGSVTDNGNGTYTAVLTGTTSGTASTVNATIGGSAVTSSAPTVTVNPGSVSLANSLVTVSSGTIASGTTSTLTLISKDAAGNLITTGGQTVAFSFSGGGSAGTIGAVTDNGDGTYTAVLTGTLAGSASTVHATIGGSAVTSMLPTVTVTPGSVSLAQSVVSVSAATISSGGTSTLTLTAKDAAGNQLVAGGLTVAFTFSGGGSAGTIGSVTDNNNGTYTATLTGTTSGTASTVHSTIGGSAVTSSLPTVTVNPGGVSLAQSVVSVSAATIQSGSTSTLTLTAKDAAGNQLTSGGLTVAFTFSGGGSAGSIGSVTDHSNGTYTATLTGTTSGTASTVHATIGGSAVTSSLPTVTVDPGSVSLAQSVVSVSAGTITSGNTSTLTLTAKDAAGNQLTSGGLTVAFTFSGGASAGTIGSVTDNSDGTYTATLTGTTSGTASTVHATIGGSAVTSTLPTITVNPGAATLAQSVVSVSAATINSGGTSTLTLTAKDAAGNQLTSGGLTVAFAYSGGGSAGTIGSVTDNNNGTYTATLTGTTSGSASTVSATLGGSAVTSSLPTVTVNPGSASLAQSLVSVSSGTITSGNTSTLTLTAKDAAGNQLTSGGLTVAFTFSGGVSAGTIGSVTDNSNGTYTATLTGTTSGSASTVHATIGGSAVTSSLPTVTVNPGTASLAQSIVSVSASSILSGNTSTLTLTAKDASGNALTSGGLTVAFTFSGGSSAGTIGSVTDNSNGTYTATLTGTTSGTASTVHATIGGSAVTSTLPTVTVSPGAVSASTSTIAVTSNSVVANGSSTTTVTITLKDANNNPISGVTPQFASTGTGNTLTQPGSATDSNGQATGTIASSVAETKTLDISSPAGLTGVTTTVTFTQPAVLSISPSTFDFGGVKPGTSVSQQFTITNSGNATATAVYVAVTAGDTTDFTIGGGTNNCGTSGSTVSVNAGSTCTFYVQYAASAGTPGTTANTTVTVNYNNGVSAGQTATATVKGNSSALVFSLNPNPPTSPISSYDFGSVKLGLSTSTITFKISNTSATTNATVAKITLGGANAADFQLTQGTGACKTSGSNTQNKSTSCTFTVAYTPSTTGAETATVTLTYTLGSAQTVVFTITGTGTQAPTLGFSPSMKNYGTVAVSSSSSAQTFTLSNSGASSATSVYVKLADTTNFTLSSNNCGVVGSTVTIAAGGNCTLQVTYNPQSSGTKVTTLVATYNGLVNGTTAIASLIGSDGVNNPACTLSETTYNAHGSGTSGSPYILCTAAQLTDLMSKTGTELSQYYKLGANIDLQGVSGVNPIAQNNRFTGNLDGAGYAVLNFSYTSGSGQVGFIQRVYDPAVITNLNLLNVYANSTSGADNVGGLVGDVDSATTNVAITNCMVTGTVISKSGPYPRAGGLIGSAVGMTITHSAFIGSVSGTTVALGTAGVYAGGIMGSAADGSTHVTTINTSYAIATISTPNNWNSSGGLIGSCDNQTSCSINNSYFSGSVIGSNAGAGGLVGQVAYGTGATSVNVTNSYSAGNVYVSTDGMGGGLYGYNDNSVGVSTTNSFAVGNVICNVLYGASGSYNGCGNVSDDLTAIFSFTNSAYYSGATVTNDGSYGTTAGTTGLTGQAALSYFYSPSNAPLSSWNFTTIWQDNSAGNALPTLR
jgi:hypothetical protein